MQVSELTWIDLSALDPAQDRFRLSYKRDTATLEASIQKVGCLQPVLLQNLEQPELVHGFRRAEVCRKVGLEKIPAVFLPPDLSDAEVLQVAIELFLATEQPNPVESSLIIRKLEEFQSREEIIDQFFPKIGLDRSAVIYRRLRAVWDMPQAARDGLAERTIDPACVPYLERLDEEDREPAVDLLLQLRPTKSMQREILEYLHDITIRDEFRIKQLLDDEQVHKIFSRKPSNLPQQRDAFRAWLKEQRFPVLHRAKSAFEATRQELKVGDEIKLVPPPYYEGRRFEVRFVFHDPEEFTRRVERLEEIRNNPSLLEKLWE